MKWTMWVTSVRSSHYNSIFLVLCFSSFTSFVLPFHYNEVKQMERKGRRKEWNEKDVGSAVGIITNNRMSEMNPGFVSCLSSLCFCLNEMEWKGSVNLILNKSKGERMKQMESHGCLPHNLGKGWWKKERTNLI